MKTFVANLSSSDLTLETAGGKGASLSKLIGANFPVPPGFIITTSAYLEFINTNHLDQEINKLLLQTDPGSPETLETTSFTIRGLFDLHPLSPELIKDILNSHELIGFPPVAVRSSATAEDLPDLSFAGQQDTFLNVIGAETLIDAVRACWGSLWTARAISYRFHNQIPHTNLSLAVIVQKMVQCEASGVVFTANPINGIRHQTVINATLGLGEALVSGKVDADQYLVDRDVSQILNIKIGTKAISTRSTENGGTTSQVETNSSRQVLSNEIILELTRLCQRVADLYGEPQDIEWGYLGNKLFLLQSRPITSLFPLPAGCTPFPLRVFSSFAAVQGIVNPITPLGQQVLKLVFIGGAEIFGYHNTLESQKILRSAGERLWADITPILQNTVGQHLAPMVFSFVEPTMRQVVLGLITDPRLQPKRKGIRLATIFKLLRFLLPVAGHIYLNMVATEKRRESANIWLEELIRVQNIKNLNVQGTRDEKLAQRVVNLEEVFTLVQRILPRLISLVATGMASLNLTIQLINKIETNTPEEKAENNRLYLELTRGLPHNVTTEMDLALWKCAKAIQADQKSLEMFISYSAERLVEAYSNKSLPEASLNAVTQFMSIYQLRGVGEIDLGRERWKENPIQIFQTIQSYIKITDPTKAPDVVFKRGEEISIKAQHTILEKLRTQKNGWLKEKIARTVMRRYRAFGGLRETPKFSIIRLTGAIRMGLLESGAEFARDGILDQQDDLFFLKINELQELSKGVQKDWKTLIINRREVDEREKTRRQIPRMFLSDGQAFYEGMVNPHPESDRSLMGAPVSPGIAEGFARIVLDPRQTILLPGEILVCPGTDPAWTPLFLAANGLVMELGGLMTHGAVVAREYGIPAVVGVDRATLRIKTGQRIRVNGSNGQVEILT